MVAAEETSTMFDRGLLNCASGDRSWPVPRPRGGRHRTGPVGDHSHLAVELRRRDDLAFDESSSTGTSTVQSLPSKGM
jgi:hypothetical protein